MLRKAILLCLFLVVIDLAASIRGRDATDQLCLSEFTLPGYPLLARKSRIETTVTAKIRTNHSGRVTDTRIEGGHALFNGPIQDALKAIRTCACEKTDTETTVTFEFRLEGDETDLWAPTHVRFVQPATFIITTTPGPPPLGDVLERKKDRN
jgi:hypothetical protein